MRIIFSLMIVLALTPHCGGSGPTTPTPTPNGVVNQGGAR
jgi:hypothetical protein